MEIREIREKSGLSRAAFSRAYEIPVRTLEEWEAGRRKPPAYVLNLLERAVAADRKSGRQELAEVRSTELDEGFSITEYKSSDYEVTVTRSPGMVSIKADPLLLNLPEIRISNGCVTRIGFVGDMILEENIAACASGLKEAKAFIAQLREEFQQNK